MLYSIKHYLIHAFGAIPCKQDTGLNFSTMHLINIFIIVSLKAAFIQVIISSTTSRQHYKKMNKITTLKDTGKCKHCVTNNYLG